MLLFRDTKEFGKNGRRVVKCTGEAESLIKSINIIAMYQAVINKHGVESKMV